MDRRTQREAGLDRLEELLGYDAASETEVRRTACVEVPLTAFTLRSRSVGVRHSSTDLPRGLDLGEHVVLLDPTTRTHYLAVVADIDFTLDDTVYRLELGTRITAGEAHQWLHPETASTRVTAGDVARLLASLRASQHGLLETYRSYAADAALRP